jgi:predicted oxidoreductase
MSITSGFYGPDSLSEEDAVRLIRQAHDLGVTLFNTSDLYGETATRQQLWCTPALPAATFSSRDRKIMQCRMQRQPQQQHICMLCMIVPCYSAS